MFLKSSISKKRNTRKRNHKKDIDKKGTKEKKITKKNRKKIDKKGRKKEERKKREKREKRIFFERNGYIYLVYIFVFDVMNCILLHDRESELS